MRRLFSLILLAAVAVPAAAQEGHERDTSVVRSHGFQYFYGPRGVGVESFQRGRLGMLVDLTADPGRDSIGARVAGLTTPNSGAAKAGVQVGDLVVRFNGTRLARPSTREGDEEDDQSRPGLRLIELASRLEPGDSVRLELRRGSQSLNVTVVAGQSSMDEAMQNFRMVMPRGGPDRPPTRVGPMTTWMFSGGPFADMELVKVNPGLGEYFGTTEGLLVTNIGDDSTLGLRSGDVILAIGGRRPLNPAHALRILGTYEPNESVSFDVMRMKHRITVTGKVPERRGRAWTVTPNSFEFDFDRMLPSLPGFDEQLPEIMNRLPFKSVAPRAAAHKVET